MKCNLKQILLVNLLIGHWTHRVSNCLPNPFEIKYFYIFLDPLSNTLHYSRCYGFSHVVVSVARIIRSLLWTRLSARDIKKC